MVINIAGTERATTKLNSHCVAAAYATFMDRRRAVGISETRIQHAGPQPNWKNLVEVRFVMLLRRNKVGEPYIANKNIQTSATYP